MNDTATSFWDRCRHWLGRPADPANLALFRMAFGALLAAQAFYKMFPRIERYYAPDRFHFTYPFFEWVRPFPELVTHIEIAVLGLAALALMLGAYYRLAAAVVFLTYTHLFLIEKALYNNHYYLIVLLSLLFLITNAHAVWGLDTLRPHPHRQPWAPFWNVAIFRGQFVVLYVFAGVAKLNADWLRGEPMRHWLHNRADYPLVGPLFDHPAAAYFFSYGGLIFDLAIPFLLLWRRTRLAVFGVYVFFHLMNAWLFTIGIFPWMALAAAVLFFDGDRIRRAFRVFGFALPAAVAPDSAATRKVRPAVAAFLVVWFAIQIVLPLRHYAYGGVVSWHEAGHSLAWHMKIRDKDAEGVFVVVDSETGERFVFDEPAQRRMLTGVQRERMLMRPWMILQYAHFLRDQHEVLGVTNPRVYAAVQASLNGRPWQPLIDPTVDLAHATYPLFRVPDWVEPLPDDLEIGQYPDSPPPESLKSKLEHVLAERPRDERP